MHYKTFFWVFIIIFLAGRETSFAQNESAESCHLVAAGYAQQYALLLQQGNYDELAGVLFEWEQSCGYAEPVFRARALQLIAAGEFPGMLAQYGLLDFAIAFEVRYNLIENEDNASREEYFDLYSEFFGFVPINSNFDRQTQQWARRLIAQHQKDDPAFDILTLYSGNTREFFSRLKEGESADSLLMHSYEQRVNYFRKKPELNLGISSGIWLPNSDLSVIGVKPSLAIFAGIKTRNTYIDGIFEIRFGKSSNSFEMSVKDTLVQTRNYQGGFIGLETSQVLWRSKATQLGVFVSAGYDIIDMVEDGQDPQRQTFGSFTFATGPMFEYVFPNRTRIGIKPGWQFLNHVHNSGTSLKGNAWSIRLILGFTENARKTQNLKRLGY